jgi:predicted MPP superfamily phosphohydrolase
LRRAFWWRLLLGLFIGGQVAVVVWTLGGRAFAEYLPTRPPQVLSAAGYLWHLLILPVTWLVVATVGLLFALWQAGRGFAELRCRTVPPLPAAEGPNPDEGPEELAADITPLGPTRRQFLGALSAATPALLTCGGVGYSLLQLPHFRVRSLSVPLAGLPPELDGLRIALVSDLHVGTFTTRPFVKRVVEATSRLDADLVLLPGDLINNNLADLSDALDAVANLQSRHGAYLSIGNHDLIDNGTEFVRRAKSRVELLVDESRTVPVRGRPVQLLGLPWNLGDEWITRSVEELAGQVTPGAFPILLAHHPHAFDAAAAAGIPLTLSGHTHGGQLMLSQGVGFGPLMYRYWSGLYRKPEQDAALVVSNGAGHWFPVRTGAPAEIIDLTLRRVASEGGA